MWFEFGLPTNRRVRLIKIQINIYKMVLNYYVDRSGLQDRVMGWSINAPEDKEKVRVKEGAEETTTSVSACALLASTLATVLTLKILNLEN